jgi:alpha-tubulin suppressor-like RCC1 family protein
LAGFYSVHIKIRYAHDKTYYINKTYKKWTDTKYSSAVHKSVLVAFVVSFAFFQGFQYLFPGFNLWNPNNALAGANTKTWTTRGDFESGTGFSDFNITGAQADSDANLGLKYALNQNLKTITAGENNTVGLKQDGTLVSVGGNLSGQLNFSSWTNIKSIAVGAYHTVGLKQDGTVVAVGESGHVPTGSLNVSTWTGITAISAGYNHTVGLKQDGTVVAVGSADGYAECLSWTDPEEEEYRCAEYGDTVSTWTGITAISAGYNYTVGLKQDGTVVAIGAVGDLSAWSQITAIAARMYHIVGLKQDGTVVAVGNTNHGQLNTSSWTNITAIAAGMYHTVGLKQDGTVVAVGYNDYGQLNTSSWTNITAIAAGTNHTVGLKQDGTVVAVGSNGWGQLNVSAWTNIRQPSYTYTSPATLSGLKINAGAVASWASLTWNTSALPSGAAVTFKARSATTDAGLTSATWSDNYVQNTAGTTTGTANLAQSPPAGVSSSVWLELSVTLSTSDFSVTPTLNDFTVTYDTLEAPTNSNLILSKTDTTPLKSNTGTTITGGVSGAYTNETSLRVTANNLTCGGGASGQPACAVASTNLRPEVQASTSSDFSAPITVAATGSNTYADLTGLAPDTAYHLRVRAIDDEGRVSGWTSYGGNESTADVTVEQTTPTAASGALKVQFSQDGTNWGAYSGSGSTNNKTTDWTNYKTVTAGASAQDIANAWYLEDTGDANGSETVYVRVQDNAGNGYGTVFTSSAQFESSGRSYDASKLSTTDDQLKLIPSLVFYQTGPTMSCTAQYETWADDDWDSIQSNVVTSTDPMVTGIAVTGSYFSTTGYLEYSAAEHYVNGALKYALGYSYDVPSAGPYNSGPYPGNSTYLLCLSTYNHHIVANVTVQYYKNGFAAATYTSSAIQNTGLFTNIDWSDTTDIPNSGSVTMKVIGGDNSDMANPITSPNLNKGDLVPENIRNKAYLKYELTLNPGNGGTEAPIVYDVFVGKAAADTITLDSAPPTISAGTITSPNSTDNKNWKGGTARNITWTAGNITDTGGSNLTATPISLSYYNGSSWADITGAQNIANSGSFSWTPPSDDITNAKIRIKAKDNAGNESTQESAEFVVDSSAPTGSLGTVNATYSTSSISVPYTVGDGVLGETLTSVSLTAAWDDWDCDLGDPGSSTSATASDPAATRVKVTWSWNMRRGSGGYASASLRVNGSEVLQKTPPSTSTYSGSETTGWFNGNSVDIVAVAGACSRSATSVTQIIYEKTQTISGVKHTNLYYTRQTSAPYTWTPYPNATTPTNFTASPMTFDTAQLADGVKDGNYGFKLVIEDNAGNISAIPDANTAPEKTTFIDTVAPTPNASNVTNISSNPNNTGNQTITWGTFTDAAPSSGFQKYEIFRKKDAGGAWTLIKTETTEANLTYADSANLTDGTYYYKVDSYDLAGNMTASADSAPLLIDKTAPTMTYNTITSPNGGESWTGGLIRNVTWDATKIVDNAGGVGLKGANNIVGDEDDGTKAITLSYANATTLDGNTVWAEIGTLLNNGNNGCAVATSGCYPWRLPNYQSSTMWVRITATDNAGNQTYANIINYDLSDAPFTLEEDASAPEFSTPNLAVSPYYSNGTTNFTTPATTLSWNAPTDSGSGVAELQLWVKQIGVDADFRLLAGTNLIPESTSYTGTFTEGNWQWKLKAVDGIGVQGYPGHEAFSPTYSMTTDGTAPSGSLSITPLLINGYTATNIKNVNLSATATDSSSGYAQVTFSNSNLGPWTTYQSGLSFANWDLAGTLYGGTASKGTKTVYLKFKDNIGNISSAVFSTIVWDDSVPAHPSNISFSNTQNLASDYVSGSWEGNSSTRISWSAATDPASPISSGIHHYAVYRAADSNNPVHSSALGVTANLYWDDASLLDGHTYYYWVQAFDNAMNATTYQDSSPGGLTLADITNPETPQNFTAVGISSTTIRLSFNSAPDNSVTRVGKADHYQIFRTNDYWTSEPLAAADSYNYIVDKGTITFEQSPYYKGSELYEYDDTVGEGQWYYYRAQAFDAQNQASGYVYYKARGNFAPVFNQGDISLAVNNNHSPESVSPGDTITVSFKVTDADGRGDLDSGNAVQQIRITDGSNAEVLAYSAVSTKSNITEGGLDGYTYTYNYTVPTDSDYGAYTVSINVKDSVGIGTPGSNSHNQVKNIIYKVPPAAPRNISATGYSSTQIQLDWDNPSAANGGLRTNDTYEIEKKLVSDSNFTTIGYTQNTDYRINDLLAGTAYVIRVRAYDVSGNGGAYTAEQTITTPTPAIPSQDSLELKDASTISTNSYRILLLWGDPYCRKRDYNNRSEQVCRSALG